MHEPDEQELRVLLERTAPRLTAPADRMARVRRKVVRRRRRRTSATVAALVTGALAVALAQPWGAGAPQRAVEPMRSATSPPGPAGVRFPGVHGVTVSVPPGWHALEVRLDGGSTVGHLSDQPLASPSKCGKVPADAILPCPPRIRLGTHGTIVAFRVLPRSEDAPGGTDRLTPVFPSPRPAKPQTGCLGLGGKAQRTASRSLPGAPGAALHVTVCSVLPDRPDSRLLEKLLRGVRFDTRQPAAPSVTVPAPGPPVPRGTTGG